MSLYHFRTFYTQTLIWMKNRVWHNECVLNKRQDSRMTIYDNYSKKEKFQIIRVRFKPTNSKTQVSGLNHWAMDSVDYHCLQRLCNTISYVTWPLRPITSDCRERIVAAPVPVKPKFHYTDFHRNFPSGKVVDTNHESRRHKWWQIMKPWSFGESRWHRSRKSRTQTISTCWDVCNKVCDKSATNLFVSL